MSGRAAFAAFACATSARSRCSSSSSAALARQQVGQALVFLFEFRGEGLQLRLALRGGRRGLRDQIRIERQAVGRLRAARVGARQPEGDVKQLADRRQRVELPDRLRRVDRLVAQVFDDLGLVEDRGTDGVAEGGLVNQRAEVILVRQRQRGVVAVHPVDRQLQRARARRSWRRGRPRRPAAPPAGPRRGPRAIRRRGTRSARAGPQQGSCGRNDRARSAGSLNFGPDPP